MPHSTACTEHKQNVEPHLALFIPLSRVPGFAITLARKKKRSVKRADRSRRRLLRFSGYSAFEVGLLIDGDSGKRGAVPVVACGG